MNRDTVEVARENLRSFGHAHPTEEQVRAEVERLDRANDRARASHLARRVEP